MRLNDNHYVVTVKVEEVKFDPATRSTEPPTRRVTTLVSLITSADTLAGVIRKTHTHLQAEVADTDE